MGNETEPATDVKRRLRLNIDQELKAAEQRVNQLRENKRALDTAQKIIVGGMVLTLCKSDPVRRAKVLADIERYITRDVDKRRLKPLVEAWHGLEKKSETLLT